MKRTKYFQDFKVYRMQKSATFLFIRSLVLLSFPWNDIALANEGRYYLKRTTYQENTDVVPPSFENKNDSSTHIEALYHHTRILATSTLKRTGNDGSPASAFPLPKCHGDCDTDADCATNLKCYQRKSGDDILKIPGCITTSITKLTNDGTDYCYDPKDAVKSPSTPIAAVAPRRAPVAVPQSPPKSAPTTTKEITIVFKGEDWTPRDAFPLGRCEGDCDGDSDCRDDLVCHHRDKDSTGQLGHVPSCVGRDTTTRDYCIRPSDEIAIPPVSGAFRFKKYWQMGYKWQDEFWEQEWCMECNGGASEACEVDDSIIISHCSHDRSTWFVYKNLKNDISQIQIAVSSNLCLQLVGNNDIRVRVCDGTNQRQKFQALNGSFGGAKFELGTIQRDGCISQHHHPKDEEIIFRMDCALTRKHTTSYWMQY
jgi:hypothetical protein